MYTTESIASMLGQYIAAEIVKRPNRSIQLEEPLITSGLIDSFSLVDLALYVENQFGVHIDDTELNSETFDTLAQLCALVQERLK